MSTFTCIYLLKSKLENWDLLKCVVGRKRARGVCSRFDTTIIKFLQWLQNELAPNFEPLKEELTCVFIQVVVLIFPNLDFLQ